jgi:methylenetetrahydrofolate dehydrogenase (NADP+)/methenyltetrahydrofolate cyclohydrolase
MQIIDGKKIRDEILSKIQEEVASLPFKPVFCDVLVGDDKASMQYVQMKKRNAEAIGIDFHGANFPATITTEDLIKEIEILNKVKNMCGIIVQLPLPKGLDQKKILDAIDPRLDVDCLGEKASKEFYNGKIDFGFPAALACLRLLDSVNLDLNNKKIVVLGNGELVGKPVGALLNFRGLKPIIITSGTENKEEIIKEADVIISGIGKGKYITQDILKEGVILIDAGTSESNGGIVGDVDFESVKDMVGLISPVPGGVGPVTIAMLFNNVLNVAKKNNE